jgi:hypothetical protein
MTSLICIVPFPQTLKNLPDLKLFFFFFIEITITIFQKSLDSLNLQFNFPDAVSQSCCHLSLFWMVTGLPIFRPLPVLMKLDTESVLLD